ncbi:MAG: ferrous iron transporter B [Deltaproteobacteria bacterium]|nr:ferrous iron transporter B [Deltaproteobacteria bacterium]
MSAGRTLILIGNPNVGKSVIFGALTGRYATVSNYPGTTVEVSRGPSTISGGPVDVIDSPGVNSLVPMSEDERVTGGILLNTDIATVVQVIDAKNLRRGLLITLQLIEIGLPATLVLNMYDEAGERGMTIDLDRLTEATGLNAVPAIATQRWNLDKIKDVFSLHRRPEARLRYPDAIEDSIGKIALRLPELRISPRSAAIMLLSGDATMREWLSGKISHEAVKEIDDIREKTQAAYQAPIGSIINRVRLKAADNIVDRVVTQVPGGSGVVAIYAGAWSMHPVWGIPILLAVLFLMYEFVGVLGAGVSVNFLEQRIFGAYLNPWAARVVEYLLPSGLIHDLIVGQYGIVTMAFTYAIAIVLPIVGLRLFQHPRGLRVSAEACHNGG